MKKLLCLLCALLLLLSACSAPVDEGNWKLYFPSLSYLDGAALEWESHNFEQEPTPDDLFSLLLSGPTDSGLFSPFPEGVFLRSWSVENGILQLNLSEQYGGLSGIRLTLADYSIVLTLCQLSGIEGVTISVANDPMPFRYRQTMTPDDILLDSRTTPAGTMTE